VRHISVRGGMDAVLHLYETLQADLFLIFFNEDSAGEFVVFLIGLKRSYPAPLRWF
jgi:hypothetical protein